MTDKPASRETNIHIRAHLADRTLIDQAAQARGQTRSEFVLDAARQQAEEVLRDQRVFNLDADGWAAFMQALEQPPTENPRLAKLLARKEPWER
jgi:uncharacterized protein (DUF1778 family)